MRLSRPLRNNLFRQVLTNSFAFAVWVSCEINRIGFPGRFLQFGNYLLVVSFSGVGNYFIGRFEIVVYIDTKSLVGRSLSGLSRL